ncbi:glutathione S-transferase family protein [Amphritea sp. HPY]|uniref:glutathione S-transferase family protein n=1 Tax=Amphritea sp. HPY TaxID=3421652 RepID=UPI003D7C5368
MMNAQVHILGPQFSTFVRSVMLCCEEKGITYSYGFSLEGSTIEMKSKEHLALHPFGKIPVLLHGERKLYETATICRYLDAEFDGPVLQPEDSYDRALVDQWCAAISLYIDQAIVREYLLEFAFPKGENGSVRMDKVSAAQPYVKELLQMLEVKIGGAPFICGEQYSIADALVTPMLDYLANLPQGDELLEPNPLIADYVERMRKRESGLKVLRPLAGKK